jgi:hypothetical protein
VQILGDFRSWPCSLFSSTLARYSLIRISCHQPTRHCSSECRVTPSLPRLSDQPVFSKPATQPRIIQVGASELVRTHSPRRQRWTLTRACTTRRHRLRQTLRPTSLERRHWFLRSSNNKNNNNNKVYLNKNNLHQPSLGTLRYSGILLRQAPSLSQVHSRPYLGSPP